MLEIIKEAIKGREEISFNYSGIPRIVQPAAVGISRAGKIVLRCFQIQGGHITPGHEWDLCEVALISKLAGTGKIFFADPPLYKRGDRHMLQIYAEL